MDRLKNFKTFIEILVFISSAALVFSTNDAFAQDNPSSKFNYSVKGRWNIKLSHSLEKTPYLWDSYLFDFEYYRRQSNYKIEFNYGVTDWLEVGLSTGVQLHKFYIVPQDELFGDDYFHRTYYIPTVGINAKFHILPFIVKDTKNRWEWYVIAKYGGGFVKNVPHWAHHNGTPEYYDKVYKLYRHEYGVGMGVGVFFWDCLGLFAEQSIGQFSLFPEDFNSILSTRVGIQVKF